MNAIGLLGTMVIGTILVVFAAGRPDAPPPDPVEQRPPEAPWLTREAAAQIIGDDGGPGPLFAGVELGGPPPAAAVRARIEEFARANRVAIRFDVHDDELAAIRFSVTFGGCCGYEGADTLAMRLHRPRADSGCCGCGRGLWVDDWANPAGDFVIARGKVRVNRVEVRWERALTQRGLLERGDELLGAEVAAVAKTAGDRWHELEPHRRYLLEVPYAFDTWPYHAEHEALADRHDLGMQLVAEHGRITEVTYSVRHDGGPDADLGDALRGHYGKPRIAGDTLRWRAAQRAVTAELGEYPQRVTLHATAR